MKTNYHLLISGYYGFDNSGDDAILKAMIKDIKSRDEKLNIKVLSNNPIRTKEIYNVESVNRFNYREVIHAMRETDLFISGGGSLLQDVTSTRSILYYLSLMVLALILRKPIMVYANGIGPINRKFNRVLTRFILNKVKIITLRDEGSKEYIRELNVRNKNVHVTADPVFTLEAADDNRINEIFKVESIPTDKKMIGVAIRHWKDDEKLIKAVAETVERISEDYNVNVVLVPMHYPEDLKISNSLRDLVKTENCYVLQNKYPVEEIMGIIKGMDIIIGMRLHTLIYAATQEVPMVGLVYDPKIEGFLKEMDISSWIKVDSMDDSNLYKLFQETWNNKVELRKSISIKHEKFRELARMNIDKVFEYLGR